MGNLVVCCDGTWNTPEQREEGVPVPTNVVRLYNAVAERDGAGAEQLRYYHPGVGSEGNGWERLAGGSAGVGLIRNILSAYRWLGTTYRDGDGGDRLFLLDDPKKYAFHATDLGDGVVHARQALALDEVRASFSPTLWTDVAPGRDVKQVWFPGVHADVGGGYRETALSDCPLRWMVDESEGLGLCLDSKMVGQVEPNPRGVLHDSRTGLFKMLRSQPRSCPAIGAGNGAVSGAAVERHKNPPIDQAPYRPTRVLAPGDEVELSIYAAQPWNETGLYLEAGGVYELTATGQWIDRTIKCSPDGTTVGRFKIGELAHLAGSLWGQVEEVFKRVSKNEQADFRGTKRIEALPWFALVGVVANGGNPGADGTPAPHEVIPIKGGCTHTPMRAGYLYGFANDAWHFYDNNHGRVILKVRRVA